MKVKSESEVAQSCLTLRDPMDCSLPGSSIHGIFQARVLEWGAIAFSHYNGKWDNFSKVHRSLQKCFIRLRLICSYQMKLWIKIYHFLVSPPKLLAEKTSWIWDNWKKCTQLYTMSDKYNCCCCLVAQFCPTLCDPMECTCQAPLSMEYTRQEDRSELPFPSPGNLHDPGIKPRSPAWQGGFLTTKPPWKPDKYKAHNKTV